MHNRKMIAQPAEHVPGQSSMWFFVIGDLWIFSAYFACYIYDRGQNQELFLQSQQQLNQGIGVINTVIMLTSSLFVAHAVQAARADRFTEASRLIGLGGACGLGFVVLKMVEWLPKIGAGITPGSNEFFMYYYMLTGLHLLHVLLGLVILAIVRKELHGASRSRAEIVETGATYWHMVDLLWIILFALIYLMR
jgi:nitric oxide reductase NorE protein